MERKTPEQLLNEVKSGNLDPNVALAQMSLSMAEVIGQLEKRINHLETKIEEAKTVRMKDIYDFNIRYLKEQQKGNL